MKLLIPLLSLILAHVAFAADDPAALLQLRQGWEESRAEAQQKVDKLYFAELEELKKNFVQADNLAAAIAVDNAIKGEGKGDNEPAMLIKTRQARDNSLGKALKPLDKKYWQDLKKLRVTFQQQGDLAGVVAADAEIKKVLAAYKNPPKAKKQNAQAKADRDQETKADTFKGFKMEFVVIGNPNNDADDTGFGAVPYTYRISKYEVSEVMIAAYNKSNSKSKISGSLRGPDKAVTDISFNEAYRFINWLNTSQGHQAAYKVTGDDANSHIKLWDKRYAWQPGGENLFRHKDAKYFLPSENEWHKAAYYDPKANDGAGGYWDYATGSDTVPLSITAPTAGVEGIAPKTAVFRDQNAHVHEPADISRAGGLSPCGTMAQNGNVWELIESAYDGFNDTANELRTFRGGGWDDSVLVLHSSRRAARAPGDLGNFGYKTGFRVASVAE